MFGDELNNFNLWWNGPEYFCPYLVFLFSEEMKLLHMWTKKIRASLFFLTTSLTVKQMNCSLGIQI
jgi:hypothetical protein